VSWSEGSRDGSTTPKRVVDPSLVSLEVLAAMSPTRIRAIRPEVLPGGWDDEEEPVPSSQPPSPQGHSGAGVAPSRDWRGALSRLTSDQGSLE
jgi:hypothetical protein